MKSIYPHLILVAERNKLCFMHLHFSGLGNAAFKSGQFYEMNKEGEPTLLYKLF